MSCRILFITAGMRDLASTRYRVLQFLPGLEARGFEVRVKSPMSKSNSWRVNFMMRWQEYREILRDAQWADVIFIQKKMFSSLFLKKLRAQAKFLIFDFDDTLISSPHSSWSITTIWRVNNRFRKMCKLSDLVIVGNAYLAEQAKPYAKCVRILPTVVDATSYSVKVHRETEEIILGWIGQPVGKKYIQIIAPVLKDLSVLHPRLRLRIISTGGFSLPGINIDLIEWSESHEVEDLLQLDIGLMPLSDDEWNKGKCALKIIQYMMAGLPVVASNVGVNANVLRHAQDGFLVDQDLDGWKDALNKLIIDTQLRARMGLSGRQRAMELYTLEPAIDKLAQWLWTMQSTGNYA